MRRVKAEQRKLAENCNTLSDIAKTSTMMYELIAEMNSRQDNVDRKLLLLEDHFVNLDKKLQYVTGHLTRLPDLFKSTAGSPCSVSGYTTLSCGAEPHGSSLSLNDYQNRL
uniref:Uncharacterized protein n=1 Tax=Romanomermis culicivorax TaxID=13658 RepID=A0A915I096_ROMCU